MARDLAGWAEDIRRRGVVWGIDSAASAREASLSMEALAAALRVVAAEHADNGEGYCAACPGANVYDADRGWVLGLTPLGECRQTAAVLAALAPLAPLFPDTEGGPT